jgi:hypothetical protein
MTCEGCKAEQQDGFYCKMCGRRLSLPAADAELTVTLGNESNARALMDANKTVRMADWQWNALHRAVHTGIAVRLHVSGEDGTVRVLGPG